MSCEVKAIHIENNIIASLPNNVDKNTLEFTGDIGTFVEDTNKLYQANKYGTIITADYKVNDKEFIENEIKDKVIKKFGDTQFRSQGQDLLGSVQLDAKNPSINVLFGKVKSLQEKINKQYDANVFGYTQYENGFDLHITVNSNSLKQPKNKIQITPSQELVDSYNQMREIEERRVQEKLERNKKEEESKNNKVEVNQLLLFPLTENTYIHTTTNTKC